MLQCLYPCLLSAVLGSTMSPPTSTVPEAPTSDPSTEAGEADEPGESDARAALERAEALMHESRYADAIDEYERSIAQARAANDARGALYLWVSLGRAYLGLYKQARGEGRKDVASLATADHIFRSSLRSPWVDEKVETLAFAGLEQTEKVLVGTPYEALTVEVEVEEEPPETISTPPTVARPELRCPSVPSPRSAGPSCVMATKEARAAWARTRDRRIGIGLLSGGGVLTAAGIVGFVLGSRVTGTVQQRGDMAWAADGMLDAGEQQYLDDLSSSLRTRWYVAGGVTLALGVSAIATGTWLYLLGKRDQGTR